jgi:tRNA(His) 5'-end guanylyltransferase
MREYCSNKTNNDFSNIFDETKYAIFSKMQIPGDLPFFVRLDGWRFQVVSEIVGAEKPFDKKFAQCLVHAAKTVFKSGFTPALIFLASDELNLLFMRGSIFRKRIEKVDSILAGIISSTFSIWLSKIYGRETPVAFDSRIIITPWENIHEYLVWRQQTAWRNHNNAYAYWVHRKMGYKASEIARLLKGLKSKELHEILFRNGVNLAKTPQWQRRGILIYKAPYEKRIGMQMVVRRKLIEKWNLPLFSTPKGRKFILRVIEMSKQLQGEKILD